MTSVIPRSSHASIVTGSTLDPFNQESHHRYSASIGTSYGHSRKPSRALSQTNPFEVIYSSQDLTFDSSAQHNLHMPKQKPSPQNFHQHSPWHSQSNYDLIAENVKTGRSLVSGIAYTGSSNNDDQQRNVSSSSQHPVVTVVKSTSLKRSGSTVSRSATLRNRNRIKQRNKTVKRKDLLKDELEFKPSDEKRTEQKHKTKKESWFGWPKFNFPVLRKKSLKYRSVHNGQNPNFTTRHEFMNFLQMSNYNQVVGSSLPHRMKMWNYTQPLHPHPLLHWQVVDFAEKDAPATTIAAPIAPVTVTKSLNLHSRTGSMSVIDVLYQNYKARAFEMAQRHYSKRRHGKEYMKVPPPFQKLYPQDAVLLSKREVHQINTKLLVEILLRRTVAAKMEYRLRQHGFEFESGHSDSSSSASSWSSSSPPPPLRSSPAARSSISSSPSSSSSSLSSGKYSPHGHTHRGRRSKGNPNFAATGPYHNDNLVLQNESIFQNIIASSNNQSPKDTSSVMYFQSQSKGDTTRNSSFFTNPFTLDPKSTITRILNDNMQSHHPRKAPRKQMYQLTPQQQRSRSTLSSDEDTQDPFANNAYETFSPIEKNSDSYRDSLSTSSRDKMRKSDSTTNTSILHYLDQLSSEVDSVLEELDTDQELGGGSRDIKETKKKKKNKKKEIPGKSTSTMKLGSRRTVPKNIIEPARIIEKLNEHDLHLISNV
ncbi:hypothetical protein KGF57_001357 [Candida theae]|uniref:Uncharacterized protein n=1 Tax=Candida theae TaxID=1198502 RepID=A0AAD5FZV5_9ASCO|nr:uncharacterized protein KGF57_001357 [Candida theae]KAI5962917.1 hypothetical protein KGF57_001357 [Candida theae]